MSVEAQPSLFTPQEFSSLELVKQRYSPDGAHDLLQAENAPEVSAPFAFDLGREYQLAQEYGQSYKKYFIENAHYYAKESYGRVPVSEYEHKIFDRPDGCIRLALGHNNTSARESYMVPALDKTKPEWYRRRSMGDVRWVDEMQEALKDAQEGDTFVDLSPTEFNVSIKERQGWGYGLHSFIRLSRVVVENGQKKLISTAIRDYLDAPEQETLIEQLTGENVKVSRMLGRVKKVNNGISKGYVRALADKLYDNTPLERKIIPPPEYMEHIKNEQEMDRELRKIDVWLGAVYEMMRRAEDPTEILKRFRGWENAVKDYVKGESDLGEFEGMSEETIRQADVFGNIVVRNYIERVYEAGTNGCGLGSGFSQIDRNKDPMTYESTTKATSAECPKIKCRKCGWEANEHEVDMINKRKLTQCPKKGCGWKP